jgi:hypothetical protein
MKHIVYPGDKLKAICEKCHQMVSATYDYGTVDLQDGTSVADVMRATCDNCGLVVATAAQSASRLRTAIEARNKKRTQQTTVRMSRVLADIARQALFTHNAAPEHFELLLTAFVLSILESRQNKRRSELLDKLRNAKDRALEVQDCQVALYLNERLRGLLEGLQKEAGLSNFSELVRRILLITATDKRAELELNKLSLIGSSTL